MRRFELRERGRDPLPPIDLDDAVVVVGSGAGARVRLPAAAARDAHVRIEGARWTALAAVVVDGVERAAGDTGALAEPARLALGDYEITIAAAPPGAVATPPQRTESLARELVRGLLGGDAAPALELPSGARRPLPPPEATVVIGRGDDADVVIVDEDLSRAHAELRRGWDGVTIRDLGSKNGTRVDGVAVTGAVALRDGARIELGKLALVFRDPAERHLRGELGLEPAVPTPPPAALPAPPPAPALPRSPLPVVVATAIAALAAAALVWVLAS